MYMKYCSLLHVQNGTKPSTTKLTVIGEFLLSSARPAEMQKVEGFVGVASPAVAKLQQTTVKLLPWRH